MRVVIQRVLRANVTINKTELRSIQNGLVVLLGIEEGEDEEDINWLCGKIARLRVFDDENGNMNKNVMEVNGSIMVISQFTLHASTKKGNRPSYIRAAKSEIAIPLYNKFLKQLRIEFTNEIVTGDFGADMQVELLNDGPVTIVIDTKNKE